MKNEPRRFMAEERSAIVIGGGVAGLCAAHLLAERLGRDSVLLLEKADEVGGYCRTDHHDGFLCDWGPNGFIDRDPVMREWIYKLRLSDQMVAADAASARRFLLRKGRLVEIVPPPKIFLSPVMSLPARLRMLCEPLIRARRNGDPETIWQFARRRLGREAADVLVSSMVTGVFAGDAKALSVAHCFPRLKAWECEHGSLFAGMRAQRKTNRTAGVSGPLGGALTTFKDGIGQLPQRAAELLGEVVHCGAAAERIERAGDAFAVTTAGGTNYQTEAVVVATPPTAAGRLVAQLDGDLANALRHVPSASIAVACLAYPRARVKHPLDGFGYLVPPGEGGRVIGCIWTHSVFPHSAPEDYVFLRAMIGGARDPDAVNLSEAALLDEVRREIEPLLGIDGAPTYVKVYRHKDAIPQYTLDHGRVLDAVEQAERAHPGLAFAGNGYWGVGLIDAVNSAHRAVEKALESVAARAGDIF
ncbi:MAG: protoporphyrinogen oxidase [Candidatus Hydrogenedentales bacterium]